MRYAAAGCLIAAGLLVGGSAGVAIADPGEPHRGGDGNSQGADKSHTNDGGTRRPGDAPKTRIGSGRDDGTRKPGPVSHGQSDDGYSPKALPGKSPTLDGEEPGIKPSGDEPVGKPGGDERDDPCPPGFPFPFPFFGQPSGGDGWSGFDYFGKFPSWPFLPEAQRRIDPSIVGEEPVIDTAPGGGGAEPVDAAGAEPPVLEAPLIVVPPGPVASVPPVVPPPAAPTTTGWIGPRPAGEPVGGSAPPIAQSGPPVRGPLPAEPGAGTPAGAQSSIQVNYGDYLRSAGLAQLAVTALPGIGGILILTAGGSFIGYRQAKTGHSVRTRTAGRFLH